MGERPAGAIAQAEERVPVLGHGPPKVRLIDPIDTDGPAGWADERPALPRPEPENDVALARMLALATLAGLGMWTAILVAIF